MTTRTCPACQYPHTSPACNNPGCPENPGVSPEVIARWALDQATRDANARERALRLRLWGSSFGR